MDALFFLKHSKYDDVEIRYALRAIERHMPWVRRVVVFGDRPAFLAGPESGVLHVPHERIAWVGNYKSPVTNFFLMFYLTALLPELDEEYLWFCDDFILLDDLSPEQARAARYLQDLSKVSNRGKGLWKESLWRTYDLLKRLGYTGWNFETHVPTYFHKAWVLDAFRDFRDFITEDRWYGLLGPTAILNHAWKADPRPLVHVGDEKSKAGFYGKPPAYEEVLEAARGRRFLNFDDGAMGDAIQRFLAERFPEPSRFERR
jgi:hypothetical protein